MILFAEVSPELAHLARSVADITESRNMRGPVVFEPLYLRCICVVFGKVVRFTAQLGSIEVFRLLAGDIAGFDTRRRALGGGSWAKKKSS